MLPFIPHEPRKKDTIPYLFTILSMKALPKFLRVSKKCYKFKFLTVMGICYRVPTDKYMLYKPIIGENKTINK